MRSNNSENDFNETAFGSVIRHSAPAGAKSPNEGGIAAVESDATLQSTTDPRLVIRGESFNHSPQNPNPADGEKHEVISINGNSFLISTPLPKEDGEPRAAITDFLNCTFPLKDYELDILFMDLIDCLGKQFAPFKDRYKGLHGWKNSFQLGSTNTFLGYGGQNNTAFLSISGEGCQMVTSWKNLVLLIRDKYQGKITRWDGAVDDYEGIHSVDQAVQDYKDGKFNAGGNMPSCDQRGNWLTPDGKGRTFYIGRRENGKMLRIYEKGMQLGKRWDPWVRWRVS